MPAQAVAANTVSDKSQWAFPHCRKLSLDFTICQLRLTDMGRTVYGPIQAEVDGPADSILDIGWMSAFDRRPPPVAIHGSLFPQ